jgi:hypothetical protein
LTDVYVARYKNARGQEFGFVRYVNVKNKDKLLQALNNIWLGQYRILAREARFDRFAHNDVATAVGDRVISVGDRPVVAVRGKQAVRTSHDGVKDDRKELAGSAVVKDGRKGAAATENKEPLSEKGRVFKWSRLEGGARGGRDDPVAEEEGTGGEQPPKNRPTVLGLEGAAQLRKQEMGPMVHLQQGPIGTNFMVSMVHSQQGPKGTNFIPSYKSRVDDLEWAKAGVVATINSGDSVLALQQRLVEAGFGRVVVKPMGGDKVFFHYTGKEDIWKIVNDAISFFSMLFSDMQKWSGEKCT